MNNRNIPAVREHFSCRQPFAHMCNDVGYSWQWMEGREREREVGGRTRWMLALHTHAFAWTRTHWNCMSVTLCHGLPNRGLYLVEREREREKREKEPVTKAVDTNVLAEAGVSLSGVCCSPVEPATGWGMDPDDCIIGEESANRGCQLGDGQADQACNEVPPYQTIERRTTCGTIWSDTLACCTTRHQFVLFLSLSLLVLPNHLFAHNQIFKFDSLPKRFPTSTTWFVCNVAFERNLWNIVPLNQCLKSNTLCMCVYFVYIYIYMFTYIFMMTMDANKQNQIQWPPSISLF